MIKSQNSKSKVPHLYKSKGKTISKNIQHDLWIVTDDATGKWYAVNYSDEHIILVHKPDA